MFPVKPSQTTTSAALRSRSRPSTFPTKRRPRPPPSIGVRLADQLVPLLGLLADREQGDGRVAEPDDLLGEDAAHVGELEEVLRPGVGVRARVDQDRRAAERRDAGRRSRAGGRRAGAGSRAARRRASRPCSRRETTASAVPSRDGPAGEEERALALLAHGVGGLLVHRDDLVGVDDLEAAGERLEHVARAEEDGDDVGRGARRARRRRSPPAPDRRPSRRRRPGSSASSAYGSGRPERLDLAAPVGAAGRADVVRPLRLMALRALDERGNRQPCASPAACRGATWRSFASERPSRRPSIPAATVAG